MKYVLFVLSCFVLSIGLVALIAPSYVMQVFNTTLVNGRVVKTDLDEIGAIGSMTWLTTKDGNPSLKRGDVVIIHPRFHWRGAKDMQFNVVSLSHQEWNGSTVYTIIHSEDMPKTGCRYSVLGNVVACAE